MRIQLAIVSDNAIPDILDPNAIRVQKITKLDTISVLFSVPNLSHVENPVRKDMTYQIKDFLWTFLTTLQTSIITMIFRLIKVMINITILIRIFAFLPRQNP